MPSDPQQNPQIADTLSELDAQLERNQQATGELARLLEPLSRRLPETGSQRVGSAAVPAVFGSPGGQAVPGSPGQRTAEDQPSAGSIGSPDRQDSAAQRPFRHNPASATAQPAERAALQDPQQQERDRLQRMIEDHTRRIAERIEQFPLDATPRFG